MDSLKPLMTRYLEVTRKLDQINKQIADLRDQRRTVELDLSAAYNENGLPDKIELTNSQMVFVAKQPGSWKKGWSLSKKQLEEYLVEILGERGKDVMREIIKKHEPKLVATEYSFELRSLTSEEQ